MLYMDNSATTRIDPEVVEAMMPYLNEEYGNPSSKYYLLAQRARQAVEEAREKVAALIGCQPSEVVFTSGATESNNMIIKGVADYYGKDLDTIITSKVEHPSVLEPCKYLETKGFSIYYLNVDRFGRISLNDLSDLLSTKKALLVSIIWGNNEIGSLNKISDIASLCQQHEVFFHTDATQVIGKIKFDFGRIQGIRFLSCSAHKLFGPKGIGAAIIRKDNFGLRTKLTPLLHGGGQENEYRSGTLAVHNIVGFGKAAELSLKRIEETERKLKKLEVACRNALVEKFGEQIFFNNDNVNKIPGILSFRLKGINNELFIKKYSEKICVSTGSACSSSKPSHVLEAIGLNQTGIRNTIRISLATNISEEEIIKTIKEL
ncbi:MAG: cysteine desulfurase family protein [Bacillota bacterium]